MKAMAKVRSIGAGRVALLCGTLASVFAIGVSRLQAATLEVVVAGYYGENKLSSGSTLSDGTVVDFGLFYSGGFVSSGSIAAALAALTSSTQMENFRASNGWVSFGSGTVAGGSGDFQLSWSAADPSAGPGLGKEFNLNPTNGVLSGMDLVGKTPFLWIQTAGAIKEFGVFVSNQSFTAAGFGANQQVDAINDLSTGVTSLYGSTSGGGITTKAFVASTNNLPPPTLALLVTGTPVYSGGNTTITHTFSVGSAGNYILEYKSSLSDAWKTNGVSVSNPSGFSVTFTNAGVNSTNEWKNRMFFRIKNG